MTDQRPISLAILAMGGEGGAVLSDWLIDVAERGGWWVQSTSVPGVAQRTGATIYYLEFFPAGHSEPVLGLMPVPGEVDVVIASELMEAARGVQRGLVTPDRTALIFSTHRVYSMTEKIALGDGTVDSETLRDACRRAALRSVSADFAAIAEEAKSPISSALLGAIAASGFLPFAAQSMREAIERGGIGVKASLRAFDLGAAAVSAKAAVPRLNLERKLRPEADTFPSSVREIVSAALDRLTDYQDAAYAAQYVHYLEPLRAQWAAENSKDADVLGEAARHLALWMTYEDASRVAQLKIRRSRFERVKQEVRLQDGQLLDVDEFLYPRVEEVADVLPTGLGRWVSRSPIVRRSIERLTKGGMIVTSTSVSGFVRLWLMAKVRRFRRKSLRFREEHERIQHWLRVLREASQTNPAAALEVAQLPDVLKGYGDTHRNGLHKYELMLKVAEAHRDDPALSDTLRRLREIANADEAGEKLASEIAQMDSPCPARDETISLQPAGERR